MSIVQIRRATRAGSHVLISLTGPSGSGKTYSAILLARGLVGPDEKIGFLDTECGRASLYSDVGGGFDVADLTSPFSPDRYAAAITEFQAKGYKVLVIDSMSHEHEGIGGLIEMAEATGRKDYGKWAVPKAKHKQLMNTLTSTPMHIIMCLRARQPIREETGASGRKEVVLGDWKEIAEKSFIYEMTVSVLLRPDGTKKLTKCPESLVPAFGGDGRISIETGERVAEWVSGGAPIDPELTSKIREGEDIAGTGKAMFVQWWNSRPIKPWRDRLEPYVPNFKSIAEEADRVAENTSITD